MSDNPKASTQKEEPLSPREKLKMTNDVPTVFKIRVAIKD